MECILCNEITDFYHNAVDGSEDYFSYEDNEKIQMTVAWIVKVSKRYSA